MKNMVTLWHIIPLLKQSHIHKLFSKINDIERDMVVIVVVVR